MIKFNIHTGLRQIAASLLIAASALLFGVSCMADDNVTGNCDAYGYVQFRLYKAASYEADTRATFDYLADAGKVNVMMSYNGQTISQTLTLAASDEVNDATEWGLRSEKLQLLTGHYTVIGYTLYNALDEAVYNGIPIAGAEDFDIVAGGLTPYDFTADVTPRGYIKFRLVKDMSEFKGTRADVTRQYTFDEIRKVDIFLQNTANMNDIKEIRGLKMKFHMDFPEEEHKFGYRTSYSLCDSLVSIPAGQYRLYRYIVYNQYSSQLERNDNVRSDAKYTIEDNKTLEADIPITLYETDEYIKDYYALRDIWEALDGENWYYSGNNFTAGVTWDFNKDVDLWGDQPGVTLHTNGRVASLDLSNFGFRGHMPAAIGQLTELTLLYLGSHNDTNLLDYDPTVDAKSTKSVRERHLEYGRMIHIPTQLSEPLARGLKEHNISIPEIALYDKYTESEVIDRQSGHQINRPGLYDIVSGRLCNGLKSLPKEIGKLKKLETLFIANSTIESLPDEIAQLESLTDLEVYNCPNMKQFPMCLAQLPNLVSANLSNNKQWSSDEVYKGLQALADGVSKEKIQILYLHSNNLTRLPDNLPNLKKIGLLDLADNKIEGEIGPFGREFAPVQFYLDNNKITNLVATEDTPFCNYADIETFSVTYNDITKLPDIFSSKSRYVMSTVDFSNNKIDGVEHGEAYQGINVETLSLAANKFTVFPKEIFDSGSIIGSINLRGNFIETIPEHSFDDPRTDVISTIDLSYNHLSKLPNDLSAITRHYLYGIDVSYNRFDAFPY